MRFTDEDEARFVADQLAEAHDAMGVDNRRAARLLIALDQEAPDAGVLMDLLLLAGENLARRAQTGDEQAKDDLLELLEVAAGHARGQR